MLGPRSATSMSSSRITRDSHQLMSGSPAAAPVGGWRAELAPPFRKYHGARVRRFSRGAVWSGRARPTIDGVRLEGELVPAARNLLERGLPPPGPGLRKRHRNFQSAFRRDQG